jgi:hypothetical protein
LKCTLGANWFYPLALGLFAVVWALDVRSQGALGSAGAASLEIAVLVDVFLTLPALYWLCFRKRHGSAKLLLGITAVVCSGLWLAGLLIPAADQQILPHLSWLRYAGLAIIIGFEVRLAWLTIRMVWRPQTKVADLAAEGVPLPLAKLMLLEARFWRWVIAAFRK